MAIETVHSPEPTPEVLTKSVFLAGPSPRAEGDPNWRPQAMEALQKAGYDGTVFVPIPRDGRWPEDYLEQVNWEQRHLELSDVVAVWLPRDLERLPGFTTNVEFGELLRSGRLIYGRPADAPHTRYLDARYRAVNAGRKAPIAEPCETLDELSARVVSSLGAGAERRGGERFVPYSVWRSRQFQAWYAELVAAGNRLDDTRVLWTYHIPQADDFLLCYALQVKVWVAREQRHKSNEFILSRPDISSICAYAPDARSHHWLDTKVLLVKEFRSPGRTQDGFLRDLPGGSSFRPESDALQVASKELEQETGLQIPAARFRFVVARQMAGTFGTHKAHVFAVELTAEEMVRMEEVSAKGTAFGVAAETERTYLEVRTLRQILSEPLVDHAVLGIIAQVCLGTRVND